jgi:hypothetical protein
MRMHSARVAALVLLGAGSVAQPSGSCLTNTSIPCPPPSWAPEWNLTRSTIVNPGTLGFFEPLDAEPWGLVSLDWQVARSVWGQNDSMHATVEATSREGCRRIKQSSPSTRCFMCVRRRTRSRRLVPLRGADARSRRTVPTRGADVPRPHPRPDRL